MLSLLIALILLIGIAVFFYKNSIPNQIKRWQRTLKIHQQQSIFDRLYAHVNGFILSQKARLNQNAIEFIYGEIEFEPFIALLSLCKPNPNTIFYDLGSGVGKAVIACAMVFDIKKSYGIELFANLHACAEEQKQRLILIKDYQDKAKKIIFKQGNFLNESLYDATLIFINATTFIAELWEQLSKHLEQVKPTTLIITTSKALVSTQFIIKKTTYVKMSWGIVLVYIQQRLDNT